MLQVNMASASAIALPYLFFNGNRTYLRKNPYVPISTITRGMHSRSTCKSAENLLFF